MKLRAGNSKYVTRRFCSSGALSAAILAMPIRGISRDSPFLRLLSTGENYAIVTASIAVNRTTIFDCAWLRPSTNSSPRFVTSIPIVCPFT